MRIAAEKSNHKTSSNKNSLVISATFERVFEPSSKTDEADWFVLDENGTRQLNLDIENHATSEEKIDEVESGIETDYEDSTERKVFGDFEPIIGPIQ